MPLMPTLTMERAYWLPNEVADALYAAAKVIQLNSVADMARAQCMTAHSAAEIMGMIDVVKSGVDEFHTVESAAATDADLTAKYGRPVANVTELGLAAMGIPRREAPPKDEDE